MLHDQAMLLLCSLVLHSEHGAACNCMLLAVLLCVCMPVDKECCEDAVSMIWGFEM